MKVQFFGRFLLERGCISAAQLKAGVALQAEANVRLGTLAVLHGYMSEKDVQRLIALQRKRDQTFGQLALSEGLLTSAQLKELLDTQKRGRIFLGEALVAKGYLTQAQVAAELVHFRAQQVTPPDSLAQIYAGRPNARALEIITEVSTRMFLRVVHENVRVVLCHGDPLGVRPTDFTLCQHIVGDFQALICLCLSADMLVRIAGKTRGEDFTEANAEACAAAAEFLSVVHGNACALFSGMGYRCDLRAPQVFDSDNQPFDLPGQAQGGILTVTPLLHPDSGIDLCVIDRTPSIGKPT